MTAQALRSLPDLYRQSAQRTAEGLRYNVKALGSPLQTIVFAICRLLQDKQLLREQALEPSYLTQEPRSDFRRDSQQGTLAQTAVAH